MGLLLVPFKDWRPNFVGANFAVGEIVEIVNTMPRAQSQDLKFTEAEVVKEMRSERKGGRRDMDKTVEKAIDDLAWSRMHTQLVGKGEDWGSRLADWAVEHEAPPMVADEHGRRPIATVIAMAARGRYADYPMTLERWQQSRVLGPKPVDGCAEGGEGGH